jgi:ubiquinone/menaquinone biosynthesis C-methylase UbiE
MRVPSVLLFGIVTAHSLLSQSPPPDQRVQVEELVKRMYEKNRRMKIMRLPDIVEKLGAGPGSQIADVGCGPGEFTAVIAHVVGPQGRVYCVDKDPKWSLKEARKRVKKENLKNVKLVKSAAEDLKIAPRSLDAVLVVNAYHEFEKYAPALEKIRDTLKPHGS